MREPGSESTPTVIATEYGPLVLARTVIFAQDKAHAPLPRRPNQPAKATERPAEPA